jgi:nucleotide-binding universal stress UspA family protein
MIGRKEVPMRVLIAYDGSGPADQARQLVAGTDWPPGSQVRVVTAYQPDTLGTYTPGDVLDPVSAQAWYDAQRHEAERLARTAATGLDRAGIDVSWAAEEGHPATAILAEAEDWKADLIVVGSRGRGPFASTLLGSVSTELVGHAPCPVLVARGALMGRVVLADDGSPTARAAASLLVSWPIFRKSEVRVVTVSEALSRTLQIPSAAEDGLAGRVARDSTRAAEGVAQRTAEQLRAAGLKVEVDVRKGEAAHELIEVARAWAADLIVIGTRGRTGLTRLAFGSVARNVLHHAPCSMLIAGEPST